MNNRLVQPKPLLLIITGAVIIWLFVLLLIIDNPIPITYSVFFLIIGGILLGVGIARVLHEKQLSKRGEERTTVNRKPVGLNLLPMLIAGTIFVCLFGVLLLIKSPIPTSFCTFFLGVGAILLVVSAFIFLVSRK